MKSVKMTSSASGRGEEREAASSDDDRYRAQLYEASVRLQKSPNDSARRRKQLSHEVSALLARCSADLACSYINYQYLLYMFCSWMAGLESYLFRRFTECMRFLIFAQLSFCNVMFFYIFNY